MYADYPEHRIVATLLGNLYDEDPGRLDIGGTVESVRSITLAELQHCYDTFCQPGNMAQVVVGGVEPQAVSEHVRSSCPAGGNGQAVLRVDPAAPSGIVKPWAETQLPNSRPRYMLGF